MKIEKITMIKFTRKLARLKGKTFGIRETKLLVEFVIKTPSEDDICNLARIADIVSKPGYEELVDALIVIDNEQRLLKVN